MIDYLVIGGGVIGSFLTYTLSQYQAKTVLLEKESQTALHATTHNSALVHSPVSVGPNYGVLKSTLAKRGNELYETLAPALGVPVLANGALMIALNDEDLEKLKALKAEADERHLEGVTIIEGDAIWELEPNLSPKVRAVLTMPTAKTASTRVLVDRLVEEALAHQAEVHLGQEVTEISDQGTHFDVKTKQGRHFKVRTIINAAGTFAAALAGLYEEEVPYQMTPVRGEYIVLSDQAKGFVKHTLFPLPSHKGKGILAIPQPDGTLRLGPTATPQEELENAPVTTAGLAQIKDNLDDILENVPYHYEVKTYAGIRSTTTHKDFYIQPSKKNSRFIHVAGIDSPGVTAAPAIAEYVLEKFIVPTDGLKKNAS